MSKAAAVTEDGEQEVRTVDAEGNREWHEMSDAEQRAHFDTLLQEAQKEFSAKRGPQLTLPEVVGEFRAVKDKPGIYARPMCLEVELKAMELFNLLSDGTPVGTARIGVAIAQSVLYRANLPEDPNDAVQKVVAYIRGQVDEEEVFTPLTEREVGRLFLNTEEISRLVLEPLGMTILNEKQEDADPNSPAPTG